MIELKINNAIDRERMVLGLINAGYKVKVVTRMRPESKIYSDYFIQIETT